MCYLFSIISGVMALYTYFGRFFNIELDFVLPFLEGCCLVQSQIDAHILQYVLSFFYVSLLTSNNSMPFYCFRYYFINIFMVNLLNSNFIVFLAALLGSFYL